MNKKIILYYLLVVCVFVFIGFVFLILQKKEQLAVDQKQEKESSIDRMKDGNKPGKNDIEYLREKIEVSPVQSQDVVATQFIQLESLRANMRAEEIIQAQSPVEQRKQQQQLDNLRQQIKR